MNLAVVKLGGSTAFHPCLRKWVEALSSTRLPLVIVPGGGPFADEVRAAQQRIGFSDSTAHHMAILAMDQFALAVADLSERFAPARDLHGITDVGRRGGIPVWLPSEMASGASNITPSWDVTSDSLAAWLAGKLGSDALLLIKSTREFSAEDDLLGLTGRGIVDARFASMLADGIDFYLAGPEDAPKARLSLAAGRLPGVKIGVPIPARRRG